MRRLSVMAGAMSAAMLVNSIADAQQPPVPSPVSSARRTEAPASPTWTLFLVTVLYKSSWSVAPVAAFTGDNAKADCENAVDQLKKIRGLSESNAKAFETKGNTQSAICLQATAATQQSRPGSEAPK